MRTLSLVCQSYLAGAVAAVVLVVVEHAELTWGYALQGTFGVDVEAAIG